MRNAEPAGLDPAHVLAVCAHATGGRRGLAVRRTDGIVVCLLPSRRTASRASTALARAGYEVTSVSASRGRDLLVTGWDPAALDARLATMRMVLHWLGDQPSSTAQLVIERFRALPGEARTPQQVWELLNQAHAGLGRWLTARSGIHALRNLSVQPADVGIALRLRAAAMMELAIDDQAERQLRVAGCALVLFRRLSGQMDDDRAEDTAICWASTAFHLGASSVARDSSRLMPRRVPSVEGSATQTRDSPARASGPVSPSAALSAGSAGRPGLARRSALDFPINAVASDHVANVLDLDQARQVTRMSPAPRLRT